jgi:peptidyl-tRNA hydrolase
MHYYKIPVEKHLVIVDDIVYHSAKLVYELRVKRWNNGLKSIESSLGVTNTKGYV